MSIDRFQHRKQWGIALLLLFFAALFLQRGVPTLAQTTVPSVRITSPNNGEEVGGVFAIETLATHAEGIDQVEFFINGVSVGVDKTVPYTILANALNFPEGLATIEARATSGNLATTSSAVVALSNGADLGASIIGQSPAPSAELALDGSMELYFDQPMDSATTQNPTQDKDANGIVVAGTIEWKNNRTLRFTPSNLLAPKTTYQVVVGNSAESTLGEPLVTGLSFNFTTVGDVQVSQISPAPDSDGIAPETAITVVFNRPIIPLLIVEEQNFADFLSITPAVAGTGRWINTSVYVFQPAAPLVRGQQYQLTVSADAINGLSASGAQMAADYQASFVTAEPIISRLMFSNGSYIYDGMVGMPLDNGFQLYFAQPMNRSSAEAATQFAVNNGSVVPATYSWSENDTILTITPTQRLAYATTYQLTVATSAAAASGGTLRQPFSWSGTTVPLPSIQSTSPQNGQVANYYSAFSINFASPMDQSTFEGKVIFTPPLSADAATPYDNWNHYDTSMSFYGLASDTQYTVRILPGLRDIYGTEITQEKIVTFSTAPAQIWASALWNLQGNYALYRPNGTTLAKATHRNVSQVTAALYSLSSAELISLNYNGTWNYTLPSGQKIWQRTQAVALPADQDGTTPFYLTPNGENTGSSLPNGFYFLSLDAPEVTHYYQQSSDDSHLIVVANAQVVLKQSSHELLAWVTDLATAEPIANVPVNIYNYAGSLLYTLTTDANGLAFKSSPATDQYYGNTTHAIVNTGALFGYGSTSWDSNVDVSQFGIQSNTYFNPNEVKAYLYTDRPIYRPDQQLSFKGVLRIHDDLAYRLPTYSSVKVSIRDPQGTTIYDKVHPLTDFVTFSDQLTLTESAALGKYNISVIDTSSNQYLGSLAFQVAEYRKPTYEVAVNPEKDAVLSGQTLSADITANYYSGGAVVGANVVWNVRSAAYAFQPGGTYTRYSFSDSNYYDYCYRPYYGYDSFDSPWGGCNSSKIVASGTGVTTVAGRLPISITAQLTPTEGSRQYTIEATINDLANQQVSNRSDVVVHQTEFYAGIKSDRYVGRVGEAILLNGVALNWSAEPVANQPLTFQVIEERWDYSDGNYTLTQTPIFTDEVTTNGEGRAMTAFTPTQGGSFKAYITGQDSQGHTTKASTYLWVAGDNYVPWREDGDYSFNLVADADQYTPGDTAELLIASPYQGEATALVTVERGHIKTKEVVPLTTNSTIYQLPITADMAPNVYVSVLILKGVDANQTNPDFKVGMLELKVTRNEQTLTVNITPDRLQAGPGETVNYTVQVLDYLGNPVDADLSLALADKAALALSASNSADILDFFYPDRPLGLNTNLALFNLETESTEITPVPPSGTSTPMPMPTPSVPSANDGALGPGESQTAQDVRDNFVDTAYWRGILRTGADGVATVAVQLPDNLTTWQMDGRAVSADTKVGSAEVDIVVTKPILLDPITPRFFVQGDQVQLGALVHNNKADATMVMVSLEGTGVTILDSIGKQLIIPAGEQGLVTWDVRVNNVDRVDLVFHAVSGAYSDATRPTMGTLDGQGIPVYKYEVPEVVGTSGQLLGQDIIVESIGLPSIFGDWQATQGNLKVEIAPSLAAAMTDGLGYLEHYPYECTEQLVSKFLPNVLTTRALKNAGISNPDLEAALDVQVNAALTKLASWQNTDGGWSWWHEAWYRESDPLVTAYVLFGLSSAKEAGYNVNQTMIDKGSNYLIGQLPNLNVLSDSYKLNRQAFLLFSLATAGKGSSVTTYIDQLYNNREKLSLYGQAYLAQAIYANNSADSRLNTLVNNFISKAITSASGVHWEESSNDYWNWNSDTRTTALILGVMARLQPTNPLTANAVRWLMSNRVNGRWASTQETAWTLISLTDWMVATNELNAAYDYEVALNGSLMASGTVDSANVREPVQLNVAVGQLLHDQLNRLAIGRTAGTGNLYYSAFLNVSLPVDQIEALDQGIQISRNYYRPDAPNTPIDSAELGETIIARLTIIAPHTLHYVAIDDFYPAGLEAIDSSLLTTQQVGNPDTYTPNYGGGWNDYYWYGWRWWYFDHVELRDEKVVLSADYLPAGSYEYSYQLRAQTVGEFRAIPPTAHEFYFPDVSGRGEGSLFTVNPVGSVYTASTTRSTDSAEAPTTTDATTSVGSDQITVTIKHLPTSVEMATQENESRSSTPLIFLVAGIVSATFAIGWSRLRRHTN